MASKAKLTGWKQKRPYVIQAPGKFDFHELGSTVASDPKLLVGRTIGVSLADLTGDRAKQHLMILFEVFEVAGDKAKTSFKRFFLQSGYLKSKIRKGGGKIDYLIDLPLSDGTVRIKATVLTARSVTAPKRKDIVEDMNKVFHKYNESKLEDFVQQVLFGKIGTEIYRKVKKITPINRVEIVEIKKV
jgi:small subunit ribosomal protein S3Ae